MRKHMPKKVLEISGEINSKGYFPAYRARPEDRNHCAMCCLICLDVAITITEIAADTVDQEKWEEIYG